MNKAAKMEPGDFSEAYLKRRIFITFLLDDTASFVILVLKFNLFRFKRLRPNISQKEI